MSMIGVAPQSQSLGSREDQDDQGNTTMPWTGKQFKARHNKSATPAQAKAAASQASAMVRSGVDEGIAIATAKRQHMRGSKMPLPDLIMRRMGGEMDAGLHAGERAALGSMPWMSAAPDRRNTAVRNTLAKHWATSWPHHCATMVGRRAGFEARRMGIRNA
jgi:hypothetical protein